MEIESKIQEIIFLAKFWSWIWIFYQNSRNWIFMLNFYGFFNTSLFIWHICIHHVTYLDKLIKCLEMRANVKSVREINEIFLCIFTYIWKLYIFSKYPDFNEKWFFGFFKSQILKCPKYTKILPPTLIHKKFPSQNDKLISFHPVVY